MISGDFGYVGKERFQEIRQEIEDVERMLKAMIKFLENKHCKSMNPGSLGPFLPTNREKIQMFKRGKIYAGKI